MGSGAADIAEIVSDVRERIPDLRQSPELEDPEQARFRLFDSITAFLKSAGQKQPMAIILDDLHWADKPSLLLLEFLAQELGSSRLLIIGTYRDVELSRQHPLAETLGQLTRSASGGFQRVLLRGLTREDVGRFIEVTSGISPPGGLVSAVHTQTEGNPLFVTEVVRLLVQEGELTQARASERDSWEVRIPEGVREVIGRRLNRLSERCNETLTIASVIGREFGLDQVRSLVEDTTEDRLLETLEEALSARAIEELPRAVGRYQFTHALIQQTLYDELTTIRRVRLHARIAEVLEELYGDQAEAHAVELAHHAAEAEAVIGANKLVFYSKIAGERALATLGFEEAVTHFERGLAGKTGEPTDVETADMLFGLARGQAATVPYVQGQRVWDTFVRAFDIYAATDEVKKAVAVAEQQVGFAGTLTGVVDLTAQALELVPPDSHEAARILSRRGFALYVENADYERAKEALDLSIAIARTHNDAQLEGIARSYLAGVHLMDDRIEQALKEGLSVMEFARQLGDPRVEVRGQRWVAFASTILGDINQARSVASAMLETSAHLRDRIVQRHAAAHNALLARLVGDWQAAHDFVDKGLELSPSDPWLVSERLLLHAFVGQSERARMCATVTEGKRDEYRYGACWRLARGRPDCGHGSLARGYVNRCVNDIRRRPSQPLIQWRFHPHTAHRDRRLRSTQGPSDA